LAAVVEKPNDENSEDHAVPFARHSVQQACAQPIECPPGEGRLSIEQLAESIVPAGGRRYRVLELLVKQKRMAKTQPVPCVVREGGIAQDDSLAENDARVGLHPLDQFQAFQTLRDAGLSEEDIAARHFVTPAIVKQRLRLASMSPKLHEVYAHRTLALRNALAENPAITFQAVLQLRADGLLPVRIVWKLSRDRASHAGLSSPSLGPERKRVCKGRPGAT
jgi:ParB-like chromosome segregation protein Spo0J